MSDYFFEEDGKVHTRYTELNQSTPSGVRRAIAVREKRATRFVSGAMDFGTTRHELWAEESARTGLTPACFGEIGYKFSADHIEEQFVSEILPGLVLHSRLDCVSKDSQVVIDYKTAIADSMAEASSIANRYWRSWQLKLYAYQLGLNNIRVHKGIYLIEIWKRDRSEILGYTALEQKITFQDMAAALGWAQQRGSMLLMTIENSSILTA